jgi:hypothetical protein
MMIDRCQFISNEQPLNVQDRTSVGFNSNANDVKVRENRASRFKQWAVMNGTGHIITGNHFFQGDNAATGLRTAGLILTKTNCKTTITGNYIDNCSIEWNNEHDAEPDNNAEFSFGALTISGNHFTSNGSASWFRFLVIKPYGSGHYINGFSVISNAFKHIGGGVLDRVEAVDSSHATLNNALFRNISVDANTFNAITDGFRNPVVKTTVKSTASATWTVELNNYLPFGGRARNVTAVAPEGPLKNASNQTVYIAPYTVAEVGTEKSQIQLQFGTAVSGTCHLTARADNPL